MMVDITKMARLDTDLQGRAMVLEGVLGIPAWSIRSSAIRGAFEEIRQQHPRINPGWFDLKRDFKLPDALLRGARSVLKTNLGQNDPEEIAANLAAGLSVTGARAKSPYYWMGEKYATGILSGFIKPDDKKFRSDLEKGGKMRALDALRKMKRENKQREKMYPTLTRSEEFSGQVSAETVLDRTPGDVLLSLLSSKVARPFKNWIYKVIEDETTPIQLAVINHWLGNPGATNAELGQSPGVVALKAEGISGQMAGRHRDKVIHMIKDEMKRNPKILDWMDDYLELSHLGYGGGSLRLASMARKVAYRYLMSTNLPS